MSAPDLFKFAGFVGSSSLTSSASPQESELADMLQQDEFVKKHLDPKRVVRIIERGEGNVDSLGEITRESDIGESVSKTNSSEFAEGVLFQRQESDLSRSVNIPNALVFQCSLSMPLKPAIKPYCINESLERAHPRLVKSIAQKYGIDYNGNMSVVISEVSKVLKDALYCEEVKSSGSIAAKVVVEGQVELVGEAISSSADHQQGQGEASSTEKRQVHFAQFGKVRFFDPQDSLSSRRKDYIIKMDSKGGSVFKKHSWVSKLFAGLFGS